MRLSKEIVREYDIRGIYQKNLDENSAYYIGKALATKALKNDCHIINVGFDGRNSSPSLSKKLIEGILSTGCNVNNIGLVPTPILYYSTFLLNVPYGVIVTASHNPKEYNGFKFISKIEDFYGEKLKEFEKFVNSGEFLSGRGTETKIDVRDKYIETLTRELQFINLNTLKIAWDPACGVAGEIVNKLDKQLNSQNIIINSEVDGNFPAHEPDPTIEKNLEELKNAVKTHNCDLGIAFDGDADRIGVIDDEGEVIWGDQLVTLYAQEVLKNNPGATIIADVKTSNIFKQKVESYNGIPLIWKTGHSLIKAKMKETGALLAGEMSGHVFFKDRYYGYDDGIYAAIRLIKILITKRIKLSAFRKSLPTTYSTKENKIPCSEEQKFNVVNTIKEELNKKGIKYIDIDGVRVEKDTGWWLIRASNTSPYLITRCEGTSEESLAELKNDIDSILELVNNKKMSY